MDAVERSGDAPIRTTVYEGRTALVVLMRSESQLLTTRACLNEGNSKRLAMIKKPCGGGLPKEVLVLSGVVTIPEKACNQVSMLVVSETTKDKAWENDG